MSDGQEGDFVVQRSKGVSTLGDMFRNQSPRPTNDTDNHSVRSMSKDRYNTDSRDRYNSDSRDRYNSDGRDRYSSDRYSSDNWDQYSVDKENYNIDSKEEEMGERRLSRKNSFHGSSQELEKVAPAGLPTRIDERPKGRSRSRRNSINAEESQLTIENFGGSQDNLNYISRNPDKEPFIHTGRRDSGVVRDVQGRESRESSMQPEYRKGSERGSRIDLHRTSLDNLDNRVIDKLEREALEREKREMSHYSSKELLMMKEGHKVHLDQNDSGSESDLSYDREKQLSKATSFAELSKLKEQIPLQGGINIIYMQSDKDEAGHKSAKNRGKKTTTFAALPNQTTWKQQIAQTQSDDNKSVGGNVILMFSVY